MKSRQMPRTERGELDMPAVTLAWLGWHRLSCGGADMPAHAFGHRSHMWTPAPARRPVEFENKTGRHVPPYERQLHAISKAAAAFKAAGLFG